MAIAANPAAIPKTTINPSFSSSPKPRINIAKAGAVFVPGIGNAILQARRMIIIPTKGKASGEFVNIPSLGFENFSSNSAKETSFPIAPAKLLGSNSLLRRKSGSQIELFPATSRPPIINRGRDKRVE